MNANGTVWRVPVCLGLLGWVAFMPGPAYSQGGECFPAPDGLVAWWDGDAVSATTAYDLVGGSDGELQGGVGLAPGLVGQAFDLDGLDDCIEVAATGAVEPTNGTTVEAWVLWHGSTTRTQRIAIKPLSWNAGSYSLGIHEQRLIGSVNAKDPPTGHGFYAWHANDLPSGQWHHAAVTYDLHDVVLYLDGQEVARRTGDVPMLYDDGALRIGCYPEPFTEFIDALIDEVGIFDRALTAFEIQEIYAAGAAGKCKDEDGDGYRPPEDCDETDASIHPDAAELPGNFVDENCNGDLGVCDPCLSWRNHGEYVRCVAHDVETLVSGGYVTSEEGDDLVASAARSEIGKRGYVPPECQ